MCISLNVQSHKVSLGVCGFDWWDGQKTICPTVISTSVMSGMKDIKMAEQSVVRFMSLDLSTVEDVDACRWLLDTVSVDVYWNMCFFPPIPKTYLVAKVNNIVSHSFIYIVRYVRNHWCIFNGASVSLGVIYCVAVIFLNFQTTHIEEFDCISDYSIFCRLFYFNIFTDKWFLLREEVTQEDSQL